mgnify:CR=1 FL=1
MKEQLSQIYEIRFSGIEKYRNDVWKRIIKDYFSNMIPKSGSVLDLGCGYGEFINNISCAERHAMDLNRNTTRLLEKGVIFHEQDCSKSWEIKDGSLDLIFTSNFFEHLPDKSSLSKTIMNARKSLKPGGQLIAMGPNISALNGKYWDFWDHHLALSDQSLCELLEINNFTIKKSFPKFLPYNMVRVKKRPLFLVSLYLRIPFLWQLFGKQFLVIAQK